MYEKENQRDQVLEMLKMTSQAEIKYTKEQNFFRAIAFALEEVDELEQQYQKFVNSVSHLEVFQEMVKEPLHKDMTKTIQNLRYLIEKNYTKEDKERMPSDVLEQVRATQDRRMKMLQNVARKYFHHPRKG